MSKEKKNSVNLGILFCHDDIPRACNLLSVILSLRGIISNITATNGLEEKNSTISSAFNKPSNRMTGLLNDVLLFGKVKAGKLDFKPTLLT